MLTMRPYPASFITGTAWRAMLNAPFRWVAMTASKSSSLIFTSVRSRTMPALLTRMSMEPKTSVAVATMRSAPSKSVTDSCDGTALPAESLDLRADAARRIVAGVVAPQAHAEVVDHDRGTLAGQFEGELPADAPTRSGDDGDAVLQQHGKLLDGVGEHRSWPARTAAPPGPVRSMTRTSDSFARPESG